MSSALSKQLAHGIKATTTTAGTGSVTLSPLASFLLPLSRFSVGDLMSYSIQDGNNREWGIGTVQASSVLARTTITGTLVAGTYTQGGTAMTLSGGSSLVECTHHEGSVLEALTAVKDANSNTVAMSDGVNAIPLGFSSVRPQTVVFAGDSIAASSVSTIPPFALYATEGWPTWLVANLKGALYVIGSTAQGGTTAEQFNTVQVPAILAMNQRPNYVIVNTGHNSIYDTGAQTALQTFTSITSGLQKLMSAGITPIWTTIIARSWYGYQSIWDIHKNCNAMLRNWWQKTRCGLFFDGFAISIDPDTGAGAQAMRAGWAHDSPQLHPNNVGAYWIGKYAAAAVSPFIAQPNVLSTGQIEYSTAADTDQILTNAGFQGTNGSVGTGITKSGGVPSYWTVSRGAGTAAADCVMVAINDPTTGLKIANGLQITVGATAANDTITVFSPNEVSKMVAGAYYESEIRFKLASPAAVKQLMLTLEMSVASDYAGNYWGVNNQTPGVYPEGCDLVVRTPPLARTGTLQTGKVIFSIGFSGNASGTVLTLSNPRLRRVS